MSCDSKKSKKDSSEVNFNVYVGSETGFLKGSCFGLETTPLVKELTEYPEDEVPVAIKSLSWADTEQKELLVAFANNSAKIFNTKLRAFTKEINFDLDDSPLVGLHNYDGKYLLGQENGNLTLWNEDEDKPIVNLQAGSHLSCVKQCSADPLLIATGGKENDLKIWNFSSETPVQIFKARNIPHDELELRVPVWVQDATFLPQSTDLVAITTRYGQIRLYDTKEDNRNRPVVNMQFCDHPLMSISPTRNDRQVIVGSAQGKVGLVDIRNYGKEKIVRMFHGFNGSVRNIVADENTPYFASCSLDRYLYLHNMNEKKPVKKLYLQSRLTSLAITKNLLAEFIDKSEQLQSTWNDIDMKVLPGPEPIKKKKSKSCELDPTEKRAKKSKVIN